MKGISTILVLVAAMAWCGEAGADGPVPVVLADVAHAVGLGERTVLDDPAAEALWSREYEPGWEPT